MGSVGLVGSGPVRAIVKRLLHKLGDDADYPVYIFTKRRVGYWMEKAETLTEEPHVTGLPFTGMEAGTRSLARRPVPRNL